MWKCTTYTEEVPQFRIIFVRIRTFKIYSQFASEKILTQTFSSETVQIKSPVKFRFLIIGLRKIVSLPHKFFHYQFKQHAVHSKCNCLWQMWQDWKWMKIEVNLFNLTRACLGLLHLMDLIESASSRTTTLSPSSKVITSCIYEIKKAWYPKLNSLKSVSQGIWLFEMRDGQ